MTSDSDIDEVFTFIHQSIMTKEKILLVKNGLLKQLHSIVLRFVNASKGRNNSIEKWK